MYWKDKMLITSIYLFFRIIILNVFWIRVFNFLKNDETIDLPKLKEFADDNLSVAHNVKFVF